MNYTFTTEHDSTITFLPAPILKVQLSINYRPIPQKIKIHTVAQLTKGHARK